MLKTKRFECGHTLTGDLAGNERCERCEKKPRAGTGKRFNGGKAPLDLIPARAEIEEAKVWGAGADKYGAHNWRGGMPFSIIIGCLQRHLAAIKAGEDIDRESGALHAAHIRCNAAMLIEFANRPDLDDRYKGDKK
jgi:hypothetical protein